MYVGCCGSLDFGFVFGVVWFVVEVLWVGVCLVVVYFVVF